MQYDYFKGQTETGYDAERALFAKMKEHTRMCKRRRRRRRMLMWVLRRL